LIDFKHNLSRHDLYKEIACSHCALIPSYSEGFCFTAVEASAIGIPIISSHRGALMEVVSGQFIQMKDQTSKSLVASMTKALGSDFTTIPKRRFDLSSSIELTTQLYNKNWTN